MSVLKLGEGNVTLTPESEGAEPSAWLTVFFPKWSLDSMGGPGQRFGGMS